MHGAQGLLAEGALPLGLVYDSVNGGLLPGDGGNGVFVFLRDFIQLDLLRASRGQDGSSGTDDGR